MTRSEEEGGDPLHLGDRKGDENISPIADRRSPIGIAAAADWLLRPHPYLGRAMNQSELSKAGTRARRIAADHDRPVSHDDVLAQMSLGVWRYILPSKANKSKQKL